MKKILFFIHDMMYGGAEKVLVNLVNNMDSNKYDITVMTLFDVGVNKEFLLPKIKYRSVFKRLFKGNTTLLKFFPPQFLYKYLIQDEYDVVVSYLEGSCTRIVGGARKDIKKIAWVHISQDEKEFRKPYLSKKEAIRIYNNFNKIACVSKNVKENFEKLSGIKGIAEVVYNTNETDKILSLSKENVENCYLKNKEIKICGVAKIKPRKGFMRLAKVHKRLIEEGYKCHIYILGEGDEKEKIQKYLDENNLQDSFVFLGYDVNPYKYVAKCDLFVCPSFEEGFSTAVTESLIVGTPVVTTLCSGMTELLGENNEYGIVTENSEEGIYLGLKRLLDDKELLLHYKQKAMERGKEFSTMKTVKQTEDFIDCL